MNDYAGWRSLEKEFRELQNDVACAMLFATSDGPGENWTVSGVGHERFESLAGIAAAGAGESATYDRWLGLLKTYLLGCDSDLLSHSIISSRPDGKNIEQFNAYNLKSPCRASADYCIERARECLQTRAPPKATLARKHRRTREQRLQSFIRKHNVTVASVRRAAKVAKANMQQWRQEKLSDLSVMSQRIENVLCGKTPPIP